MNKLGKYMAATSEPPPPSKGSTECLVNGCPLPGTFRQSNETSICCVHEDEPALKWPEQTERIKKWEAVWFAVLDMSNAPPGTDLSDSLISRMTAAGCPKPVAAGMRVRAYGVQLRNWLLTECRGKRDPVPDRVRSDTWKRLSTVTKEPANAAHIDF